MCNRELEALLGEQQERDSLLAEKAREFDERDRELREDIDRREKAERTLQDYRKELEEEFAERTAELRRSNERLRREISGRKQIEESLQESDLWMRGIFNAIEEAVIVFDDEECLVNMNPAAEALFGWTMEEKEGERIDFLLPSSEQYARCREEMADAFARGESLTRKVMLRRKNGYTFPAEHTSSLLANEDGETLGIVCVVRDLSERERLDRIRTVVANISEAALEVDSLNDLLEHIHEQIGTLLDARNFFVSLYDRGEKNYTLPYIVDQYDQDFPERADLTGSMTDYVRRTGRPVLADEKDIEELEEKGEVRLVGTPSHHWMGVPLRTREGVIGVVVVQTYDKDFYYSPDHFELMIRVSEQIGIAVERKHAEHKLRVSEARNRALLDAVPDLMFVLDADGIFLDYNAPSEDLLFLPPDQFLGRRTRDVLPEEFASMTMRHIEATLSTGEMQVHEYPMQIKDREMWFEARMVPASEREVLSIIRDITVQKTAEKEREDLEAQMQHAQKLESLGVLAGGIAHDFNNLLVGILGNVNLAQKRMVPESPSLELLGKIETAAMRAADLTKQLLAYSGKGAFVIEQIDLSKIIEEMTHLLKVSISKNCVLRYDFGQNVPPIEADPTQIRQVIMNLITNASEAIGERSGLITIRTGVISVSRDYLRGAYVDHELAEGYYAYLEISDTGSGMDAETRERMFDPFYPTKFTGRGLAGFIQKPYQLKDLLAAVDSILSDGTVSEADSPGRNGG